jgi:pectate lyase
MIVKLQRTSLAASIAVMLSACGAGGDASLATPSGKTLAAVEAVAAAGCPALALNGIDAQTLTGASTPLQMGTYGIRRPGAPVLIDGKHSPANYRAAPALPAWQFATSDPTNGALSFECDVAPTTGWHSYKRNGGSHQQVVVTGGRNATPDHIYTVYNGQQLAAALQEAGLAP